VAQNGPNVAQLAKIHVQSKNGHGQLNFGVNLKIGSTVKAISAHAQ